MQHPLGAQIEKVLRMAACWTCRRWQNTRSVNEMLDELEWSSLEARRDWSSLLLFHKIHCGAVRERSGSVVECLTRDRGARVRASPVSLCMLWSLSKTHLSYLSTGSTQEDPSLFNWKIVYGTWRIKSNKQTVVLCILKKLSFWKLPSSHCAQYCRYQTYSDALKNSFFKFSQATPG